MMREIKSLWSHRKNFKSYLPSTRTKSTLKSSLKDRKAKKSKKLVNLKNYSMKKNMSN